MTRPNLTRDEAAKFLALLEWAATRGVDVAKNYSGDDPTSAAWIALTTALESPGLYDRLDALQPAKLRELLKAAKESMGAESRGAA